MINKDTLIFDVLKQKPDADKVFLEFGMHCLGCPIARGETVEQACQSHGIDVNELLSALNKI